MDLTQSISLPTPESVLRGHPANASPLGTISLLPPPHVSPLQSFCGRKIWPWKAQTPKLWFSKVLGGGGLSNLTVLLQTKPAGWAAPLGNDPPPQ